MGQELDNDTKKYLENFHEEEFNTHDFMLLFSAIYAIKGNSSFSRDNLLNFIIENKQKEENSNLLHDIEIKSNGIFYYSNNFDEAISKLKWAGILYTISPEEIDSSIYINKGIDVSGIIKSRIDYLNDIINFVSIYEQYEHNKINTPHKNIFDQEIPDIVNTDFKFQKIK